VRRWMGAEALAKEDQPSVAIERQGAASPSASGSARGRFNPNKSSSAVGAIHACLGPSIRQQPDPATAGPSTM
jgi:hypothetical protein